MNDHLSHGGHDIRAAHHSAYKAAVEKQEICEDGRWACTVHGRVVSLRDEADKVLCLDTRIFSGRCLDLRKEHYFTWPRSVLELSTSETRSRPAIATVSSVRKDFKLPKGVESISTKS